MTSTDLTPHQYTPLPEPVPITEQDWPEGTVPLVSICCITYNHEKFIEECLEGFLMQETTFPVEILIHDDASTDRTTEIITHYEKCYPRLVNCVIQKENLYSRGVSRQPFVKPYLKGRYIAKCEGDDFWIDPKKLQQQAIFLETNPEYVICGHNSQIQFAENPGKLLHRWPDYISPPKNSFRTNDLLKCLLKHDYIPYHTSSIVYRAFLDDEVYALALPPKRLISGDMFFLIDRSRWGLSKTIDSVMSVRRKNSGGVTNLSSRQERNKNWVYMLNYLRKSFPVSQQYLFLLVIGKYLWQLRSA